MSVCDELHFKFYLMMLNDSDIVHDRYIKVGIFVFDMLSAFDAKFILKREQ